MHRALAALLSLTLLAAPRAVRAWCRSTTVMQSAPTTCVTTGAPLYWSTRCITLSLNVSALPAGMSPTRVHYLLDDALNGWNAAVCNGVAPSVTLLQGAETTDLAGYRRVVSASNVVGYVPRAENTNVVIFRQDWAAAGLAPSALALTTLTYAIDTGEIRDADMMVNLTYPLSASAPEATTNDLPTVLLHEAGHVLGIDHSNDRQAVMWSGAGRGEQRRALQEDDVAAVCAIHPHWIQRQCVAPGGGPPGGCRARPAAPSGWGVALVVFFALCARRRGRGL